MAGLENIQEYLKNRKKIEKKIVALLAMRKRNRKSRLRPNEFVLKLEKAGVESLRAREELWHLLSMGRIALSSDRRVTLLPKK